MIMRHHLHCKHFHSVYRSECKKTRIANEYESNSQPMQQTNVRFKCDRVSHPVCNSFQMAKLTSNPLWIDVLTRGFKTRNPQNSDAALFLCLPHLSVSSCFAVTDSDIRRREEALERGYDPSPPQYGTEYGTNPSQVIPQCDSHIHLFSPCLTTFSSTLSPFFLSIELSLCHQKFSEVLFALAV